MRDIVDEYYSTGGEPNVVGDTLGKNKPVNDGVQSKEMNPNGLYNRYIVMKREGRTDPNAEYFVLRLDDGGNDPDHIAACRKAVLKYADEIEAHIPKLAADIRSRYAP